jgi:hypothetical protein
MKKNLIFPDFILCPDAEKIFQVLGISSKRGAFLHAECRAWIFHCNNLIIWHLRSKCQTRDYMVYRFVEHERVQNGPMTHLGEYDLKWVSIAS